MISILVCSVLLHAADAVETAAPAAAAPPDRSTALSLRSSLVASSGLGGLSAGVLLEQVFGPRVTLGVAFDLRAGGTSISGLASLGGLSTGTGTLAGVTSSTTLDVTVEPSLRRWFGARPLEGGFVGASARVTYHRVLDIFDTYAWSGGLGAELGYSLLFANGVIIQGAVGPTANVSWMHSSSLRTTSWALGLRSTLSLGFAF
jgi:hypothetical protein